MAETDSMGNGSYSDAENDSDVDPNELALGGGLDELNLLIGELEGVGSKEPNSNSTSTTTARPASVRDVIQRRQANSDAEALRQSIMSAPDQDLDSLLGELCSLETQLSSALASTTPTTVASSKTPAAVRPQPKPAPKTSRPAVAPAPARNMQLRNTVLQDDCSQLLNDIERLCESSATNDPSANGSSAPVVLTPTTPNETAMAEALRRRGVSVYAPQVSTGARKSNADGPAAAAPSVPPKPVRLSSCRGSTGAGIETVAQSPLPATASPMAPAPAPAPPTSAPAPPAPAPVPATVRPSPSGGVVTVQTQFPAGGPPIVPASSHQHGLPFHQQSPPYGYTGSDSSSTSTQDSGVCFSDMSHQQQWIGQQQQYYQQQLPVHREQASPVSPAPALSPYHRTTAVNVQPAGPPPPAGPIQFRCGQQVEELHPTAVVSEEPARARPPAGPPSTIGPPPVPAPAPPAPGRLVSTEEARRSQSGGLVPPQQLSQSQASIDSGSAHDELDPDPTVATSFSGFNEERSRVQQHLDEYRNELVSQGLSKGEIESRLKEEKIRIAIDKINKANIRKLFIEFHMLGDQSKRLLLLDETKSTHHAICLLLCKATHLEPNINWSVVEFMPELHMERIVEDHLSVVEQVTFWTRNQTYNKLIFAKRTDKNDLFVNPEKYLLNPNSMDSSKKSIATQYSDDGKRRLLEEFFSFERPLLACEGYMWLKVEGKKAWKRLYFQLKPQGLFYAKKKDVSALKEAQLLTSMHAVDLFYAQAWKKKYKAPSEFGFALKFPQQQKINPRNIHYLCVEKLEHFQRWCTALRLLKYGRRLYQNYTDMMFELENWKERAPVYLAHAAQFSPSEETAGGVHDPVVGDQGTLVSSMPQYASLGRSAALKMVASSDNIGKHNRHSLISNDSSGTGTTASANASQSGVSANRLSVASFERMSAINAVQTPQIPSAHHHERSAPFSESMNRKQIRTSAPTIKDHRQPPCSGVESPWDTANGSQEVTPTGSFMGGPVSSDVVIYAQTTLATTQLQAQQNGYTNGDPNALQYHQGRQQFFPTASTTPPPPPSAGPGPAGQHESLVMMSPAHFPPPPSPLRVERTHHGHQQPVPSSGNPMSPPFPAPPPNAYLQQQQTTPTGPRAPSPRGGHATPLVAVQVPSSASSADQPFSYGRQSSHSSTSSGASLPPPKPSKPPPPPRKANPTSGTAGAAPEMSAKPNLDSDLQKALARQRKKVEQHQAEEAARQATASANPHEISVVDRMWNSADDNGDHNFNTVRRQPQQNGSRT